MATSGHGSGVEGYNVQVAVETEHHLIVAHAVTNADLDRAQLSGMAARAKDALEADTLDAVADRGYYSSEQNLACDRTGIASTLPRPMTLGAKAAGRFGKDDFLYRRQDNTYVCPAGRGEARDLLARIVNGSRYATSFEPAWG